MVALACLGIALLCSGTRLILAQEAGKPPAARNDPLGRQSPRGTLRGFSAAARNNDFATAGRYLQLGSRTDSQTENIVRDLNELIDRYFVRALSFVSDAPTGDLADGLP